MNLSRVRLRPAWVAAGLAVTMAWGIMAFATCTMFLAGYGRPAGTSAGQIQIHMDDRQAAWLFLIILAELSVLVAVGVVRPIIRWRRPAMAYAASSHPRVQEMSRWNGFLAGLGLLTAVLLPPVGLLLNLLALQRAKKTQHWTRHIAIAGLVISLIYLAVALLYALAYLIFSSAHFVVP